MFLFHFVQPIFPYELFVVQPTEVVCQQNFVIIITYHPIIDVIKFANINPSYL